MSYLALYRKWRPLVFEDVAGQEHVTQTLKNEIKTGRVSHAYLLCGTRGTGKTSTAKIFSRAVNCLHPVGGNPCNECESCRGILSGQLLDVSEIDAASNNSVDDIRALRDDVNYSPSGLRYKIYIIDEVHMLSQSAFNALLKTLEEPPKNVIFILATTEIHKIPVTILSRCQRFDFKRLRSFQIQKRLTYIAQQEGLELDQQALSLLSRAADGSMRDALSILDQCVSMEDTSITQEVITRIIGTVDMTNLFAMTDAIAARDTAKVLLLSDGLVQEGRDLSKLCSDLIAHLRNLLICRTVSDADGLIDFGYEYLPRYQQSCTQFTPGFLMNLIQLFSQAQNDMKFASNKRVILEIAFIKSCEADAGQDIDMLARRVTELEAKLGAGAAPSASMPQTPSPERIGAISGGTNPSEKQAGLLPDGAGRAVSETGTSTVDDAEKNRPATTEKATEVGEKVEITEKKGSPAQPSDPAPSSEMPSDPPANSQIDENFEMTYWAEIISKIHNPGISSIITMAKPVMRQGVLYVLLQDAAFLDILHAAGGEQEIGRAVEDVCGVSYSVHAMLQTQYNAMVNSQSQTEIGDAAPSHSKSAPNALEKLADKARAMGNHFSLIDEE